MFEISPEMNLSLWVMPFVGLRWAGPPSRRNLGVRGVCWRLAGFKVCDREGVLV